MNEFDQLISDIGRDDGQALNQERRFRAYQLMEQLRYALHTQPGPYL